jgi:hypothetical protein
MKQCIIALYASSDVKALREKKNSRPDKHGQMTKVAYLFAMYICFYLFSLILPLFHNTCRFDFSSYILFDMYLDISIYLRCIAE